MNQYILLIQGNAKSATSAEEWERFFTTARDSEMFRGGSEIGNRIVVGDSESAQSSEHIVGYMRFDSEDKAKILDLLKSHPVVMHGGSVELCEMPKS